MKTLKTQPSPLTPLPRGEGNHPLKTKNSNLKTIIRTKLLPTPKTKNYLPKTHFLKTKDSNLKTLSAFTLVELIVVIVILAILATIAFLSFSSQSASARDSTRLSDMNNIAKGLSVFNATSGIYPKPDTPISLTVSGTTIGYQGYAGSSVLNMIKISNGGKDPLDTNTYYTYSVNASNSKFQILGFLEDGNNTILSVLPPLLSGEGWGEGFADSSSYSSRFIVTKGDTLGIILSSGTLMPVQTPGIVPSGKVDITAAVNDSTLVAVTSTKDPILSNAKLPQSIVLNYTKTKLPKNDFNFDGKADIVWRNMTTGSGMVWFMDGINKISESQIVTSLGAGLPITWQLNGIGDFNYDGKPDVLLGNTGSLQLFSWILNGAVRTKNIPYFGLATDDPLTRSYGLNSNTNVVGVGDFNGDGKDDILFKDETVCSGDCNKTVLYMSGAEIIGSGKIAQINSNPIWHIIGVNDFNLDGKPDILWNNQNTTDSTTYGKFMLWYMSGITWQSTEGITENGILKREMDHDWRVYGTSDYNNDSKPDLLWRNQATGENKIWYMSGAKFISSVPIIPLTDTGWIMVPQ